MDEELVRVIHDIRNKLTGIKGLVHMHMAGDKRFEALKLVLEIERMTGEMWSLCVGCKAGSENDGKDV